MVHNNFANIPDHWMMGVADGHGLQGHLVSNFVKIHLPKILSNLINGSKDPDATAKKSNSFLPQINGSKHKNPFEIDGSEDKSSGFANEPQGNLEFWLSNKNYRVRDF